MRGPRAGPGSAPADCLEDTHAFRDLPGSVPAIELLAPVTASEGDPKEAAVLRSAAYYNASHELCEASARGKLGDERYAACVREGARRGREEAAARALDGQGVRPLPARPVPRGPVRRERDAAEPWEASGMHEPAASPTRKGGETAG